MRIKLIILLVMFLISVGGGITFYLDQASQSNTITSLRSQLETIKSQRKQAPADQFHQDIQGWQIETEPLTSNASLNNIRWKDSDKEPMDLGYCHFVAETYRVETKPGKLGNTCIATLNSPQHDIALQVHMLLLQGNQAGIALRWSGLGQNIANYQFIVKKVGPDGVWILRKGIPAADDTNLSTGNISGLFSDRGSPITIGMKTVGDGIYLYINGQMVGHRYDKNSFGPGTVGLSAGPGTANTGCEVMFSNAEIYIPKS